MSADWLSIGNQFVNHYYTQFDTQRQNLASLYTEQSMMTYEGEQFMGVNPICEKLA